MTKATRDEVIRILGRIDDVKLAAVIALGPTKEEVIQAKLWLTQTELHDVGASSTPAPGDKVTRIYDLLRTDTPPEWED